MKKKKIVSLIVLLAFVIFLTGCSKQESYTKPIEGFTEFWDIFVYPMAGIMWVIGNSIGFHSYPVTIIIATIVVRSIAWPVYAKTNDMTLKMNIMQPELEKIQAKYAGREDQESKQRMSMETMQLYKKYGVGVGGCLMPLIQMPIFIGFYRTIARMPGSITAGNWIGKVFTSTTIFGVDMMLKQNQAVDIVDGVETIVETTGWTAQRIGVIVLAVLVGVTQIISIILSNMRQKKQKERQNSNIPEYRRPQQTDSQKTTQTTMNIMLYFMAAMMVMFVWNSAAGLGLYWVVGNIYSTLQTWIGQKNSDKRMKKLKEMHEKKGRI